MYAIKKIRAKYVLLTHATNPFIKSSSIIKGINAVKMGKYDCSLAVLKHQTYSWYKKKPINYLIDNMQQTQYLEPVFTETSGFYFFHKKNYIKNNSRISKKPFFVEVTEKESIDIDNLKDYNLSKKLINYSENEKNNIFDLVYLNNLPTKKLKLKIKHISFDLDGVLIDSIKLMEKSWNFSMKKNKLHIDFRDYKKHLGLPFKDILKKMKINPKLYKNIEKEYNEYSSNNLSYIKPYKQIINLLIKLTQNKFKISIITSKNKKRTLEILNKFFKKINFSCVITPDDIISRRGKPSPDSLYLACATIGVSLNESIYIGDMMSDFELAKNANVQFIHAKWGYSKEVFNSISVNNISYLRKLFRL